MLLSGSVDVSTSSSAALSAIMRGAPFKIVYTIMDRPDHHLWSTTPELKTLQDLKGKNVGVQTRGDTYEIAMRLTLRAVGLPTDWGGYTPMGMGTATRAAMASGSLPAVVIAREDLDELSGSQVRKCGHMIVNTFDTIRMPTPAPWSPINCWAAIPTRSSISCALRSRACVTCAPSAPRPTPSSRKAARISTIARWR